MMTSQELLDGLSGFYGTENYWTRATYPFVYTDGVHFLAENAECFWLLDLIASYRRSEDFQIWRLRVNEDKSAVVAMQEDTGRPLLVEQHIEYTNFPLEEIKLWAIYGSYNAGDEGLVLMLPSEY